MKMSKVMVMDHPLIQHKIGLIRKRKRVQGFQRDDQRNRNDDLL